MKARWIGVGTALGFALALTLGFALDVGSTPPVGAGSTVDTTERMSALSQMHDSEAMREVHAQMPAGLRAQCDALHEQMTDLSGMMGDGVPGGMMDDGVPGGMMDDGADSEQDSSSGGHASHHPGGMGG